MLMSLHISAWSGRKFDKKATAEVNELHNSTNAGKFNKILVDEDAIKKVTKINSAAREFFYKNTLAWDDYGRRLLPSPNYFAVMQGIADFQQQHKDAVEEFLLKYGNLVDEARTRLNGLFNEADYPSESSLRKSFDFKLKVSPISDDSDFRVAIDEEEQARMKKQIEDGLRESLSKATEDIWDRVADQLRYIIERLTQVESKFHDSLIGNVRVLIELLPRLNFSGDQRIAQVCQDMKALLVDTNLIKQDMQVRQQTIAEAKNIMSKYGL